MKLIDTIIMFIILILVFITLLAIICILSIYYYKKKRAKNITENEDFRKIIVTDSEEFVPIDDIADGMIIETGKRRFNAVIKCRGFDFYTSNREEKIRTQNNYTSFLSALTEPICYRQYGENINMGHTLKRYQEALESRQAEAYNLIEDYKVLKQRFDQIRGKDDNEETIIADHLLEIQTQISAINWRINHLESQIRYIEKVSGVAAGRQKAVQTYVVSWEHGFGLMAESLSEQELHDIAIVELDKLCRNKIRQLTDAGAVSVRCNTSELIDMCRRHYHPISGNRFTIEDIRDSAFFDAIVTTDSIDELNNEFERDISESIILGRR